MAHFTADEVAAIDRDNRNCENVGRSMSEILEDILTDIDNGNIGVTAAARDVDAVAKDSNAFAQDADTTTGLTFGYKAGRFFNGASIVEVSAGTLALTNNTTNYVEVTSAGVVSTNTSGFTAGRLPLYTVVTSGGAITTVTNRKPMITFVAPGSIDADQVAPNVKTVVISRNVGTVSATTDFILPPMPNFPGVIKAVKLVVYSSIAANDTNFWEFSCKNRGPTGSGTTDVITSGVPNTTQATGGSGLTGKVARSLQLHTTPANLNTAAGDVLEFTCDKNASAANLEDAIIVVEVEVQDA